jgi:hypothetical protein
MKLITKGLFAALVLVLASCGQGDKQAEAPAAPAIPPEAYNWAAIAPSTVEAGPPATLHISGGYAYALLQQTSVLPGDTVSARFTVQGQAGRNVRLVLQRHCDQENGNDHTQTYFDLTGQPQVVETSTTFEHAFSCVRLSFVSTDGQPLDLTVTDLTMTKVAGTPGGELRPSGGG